MFYLTTSSAAEVHAGGFLCTVTAAAAAGSAINPAVLSGKPTSLAVRRYVKLAQAFNVITLSRPIDVECVIVRISINTVGINKRRGRGVKVIFSIIKIPEQLLCKHIDLLSR